MDVKECYRVLNLPETADLEDVKASYRRLARQYHPDLNPDDSEAHQKFIAIHQAYKRLLEIVPAAKSSPPSPSSSQKSQSPTSPPPGKVKVEVKHRRQGEKVPRSGKSQKIQFEDAPELSPLEKQLKQQSYEQLQGLLKRGRFPRAIALAEGLAQRLPQDKEVRQWQAIVYQRWGHQLLQKGHLEKARIYLKKALRTDPHNRTLWLQVEKDFREIEKMF
jgi:curved DNA-binding protein CbpA|nr:J domain-containing protein [Geitlerinema sp. PCC 9228]